MTGRATMPADAAAELADDRALHRTRRGKRGDWVLAVFEPPTGLFVILARVYGADKDGHVFSVCRHAAWRDWGAGGRKPIVVPDGLTFAVDEVRGPVFGVAWVPMGPESIQACKELHNANWPSLASARRRIADYAGTVAVMRIPPTGAVF